MKNHLKEALHIVLAVFVVILISLACKKNRFKKQEFLESLYEFKTDPEINAVLDYTTGLQAEWNNYSTNTTSENFELVQSDFLSLSTQMEKINFYNLGDVGAIYVFNRFYKTTVDTTGIKDIYNSKETFSELDISTAANTQKGLFALEFLLYSNSFQDKLAEPKFISFVNAQLLSFTTTVHEFQNSWNVYQQNFIKNEGTGVGDSYNIVVNRIIHSLEDLINKRISVPLDANDPTLGVGHYSNQSLQKISTQVQQLNDVYLGIGTENFNSVYNNVRKKNRKLADEVTDKFAETIAYSSTLLNEMDYYIENDQASLITYKNLLIELLSFFKVDIQDELDIIITFGDTDGD